MGYLSLSLVFTLKQIKVISLKRILKTLLFSIWAFFLSSHAASQSSACIATLDSAKVRQIARGHGIKTGQDNTFPNSLVFDSEKCQWVVSSFKTKHSNRGKCKYTNGCTIVIQKSISIDDRTKEVRGKKRIKKIYPNYE